MLRSHFALVLSALLYTASGCSDASKGSQSAEQTPSAKQAAVALVATVVDDPGIAEAIVRLRGEWSELSGGSLEVRELSLAEFAQLDELEGDILIYPSRHAGMLVERGWIRPMREAVLDSPNLALADVFPVIRNREMVYGEQVIGLPLGSPPLLRMVTDEEATTETDSPLHRWEPAIALIARAAGYVDHSRHDGVVFDAQTMDPRLESPVVVRALEELIAEAAANDGQLSPLGWPGLASDQRSETVEFTDLALQPEVYDTVRTEWRPRDSAGPMTLLGAAGRLAGVTQSSRNATSAFKLLEWLAVGDRATQISSRSPSTMWYRRSQQSQTTKWPGGGDAQGVRVVNNALSREEAYLLPRIPGIDQYLDVLSDQVARGLAGEVSAEQALRTAAQLWREITDQYGVAVQRQAFRRHLGLDRINP